MITMLREKKQAANRKAREKNSKCQPTVFMFIPFFATVLFMKVRSVWTVNWHLFMLPISLAPFLFHLFRCCSSSLALISLGHRFYTFLLHNLLIAESRTIENVNAINLCETEYTNANTSITNHKQSGETIAWEEKCAQLNSARFICTVKSTQCSPF